MASSNDEIGDDDPVPLSKACKIFLNGVLTKSALRTENRKGNLEIIRIANKDFVTRNGIRRMIEKCKVLPEPPAAAPLPSTPAVMPSRRESAKFQLKAMLAELKEKDPIERERRKAEAKKST